MPSDTPLFDSDAAEAQQRWVTVSNEMVMARMDWDIMMHRVMMVLISQIDSRHDDSFRTQQVRVRDIRDMAQVSQKSIHREAAQAAAKLVRQPIEFWSDDKQDYEGYPIFAMCKYRSGAGVIEAKFNNDARPFLLQLSERFTQYRLKQAIPLSTPYAIRTYEIAKMIERPGTTRSQVIPVGRFRNMFRLEDKYHRHTDMRRRVINPSVEEVNEKCDVEVVCKDVRDGRTPVSLKWTVHSPRSAEASTGKAGSSMPKPFAGEASGPEGEDAPYRAWYDGLSPVKKRRVREEAKKRARSDGYREGGPSFEAGVEMKLHALYREAKAART